jgi:hypothetical protein
MEIFLVTEEQETKLFSMKHTNYLKLSYGADFRSCKLSDVFLLIN